MDEASKPIERRDPTQQQLPAISRSALSTDVHTTLRDFILTGRLGPDHRIVEERLATQLGVSRAPLREAVWQLKSEGLIVGAGRATRVVSLSAHDVRELHLLRATLETTLYQSAATQIASADIEALERLIRKMEMVAESDQRRIQIARLDFEFHERLCDVADLPRVLGVWQDQHVLFRLWLNLVAEADDEPAAIAQLHRTLLEAVIGGDPVTIATETSRHIYGTGSALRLERRRWAREHAATAGDPYGMTTRRAED